MSYKYLLLLTGFSLLLLSGCSLEVPLGGFFYSYSTPDERFDAKDDLPMHSDSLQLRSIPQIDGKSTYSFTIISDIHVNGDSAPHLEQFTDTLLVPGDIFILDCGDSTQSGYAEQFDSYKTGMNSSGLPWFAAIGNHDLYFEGWKQYREKIGRSIYTFQVGNSGESGSMMLIALDSANSTLGKKQMNWLEDTLKAQSGLWDHLLVFTHSQFFSDGVTTVVQFTDTEEIYKLMYLFKTYAVDYVFMGHNHVWNYREINGVRYITLDPLQKEGSEDSYVRIHVKGSNISHERIMIPEI